MLGLIDAALGRKEEALREGRRAVELLPVEKDATNGTRVIAVLANIAAWVGDNNLACQQLAIAIHSRHEISYGELKLLPVLGSVARRSVLRKNRRLPRAEMNLTADYTDNTNGKAPIISFARKDTNAQAITKGIDTHSTNYH